MIDRNIVTERDAAFRRAVMGSDTRVVADQYLERLIKLIPAEVIFTFTAIEGVVASWHSTAQTRAIAEWVRKLP